MSKYYSILIAFLICVIDQIAKYLVINNLYFAENIPVVNNILSITKVYNTGAAFSLFQDGTKFLIIFSIIVSIGIIIYTFKKSYQMDRHYIIAWGLILGGTIGNLIDRIFYGYVVDFIRLDFINFPIFNIADISINIGAFLIIAYSILKLKNQCQSDYKNEH